MTAPGTHAVRLRVLISDDDPVICEALHEVLQAEPDVEVVAIARDGDEAIALAERHAPAVAVLDLRMPGGGGVHAVREILARSPATRVLVFSAYGDTGAMTDVLQAGASEYLIKGVPNTEIVAAVRRLGRTQRASHQECAGGPEPDGGGSEQGRGAAPGADGSGPGGDGAERAGGAGHAG